MADLFDPDQLELLGQGEGIALRLAGELRRFHALWLRDNSPDEGSRDPSSGQKLHGSEDIDEDVRIVSAAWIQDRLHLRFEPCGKTLSFQAAWLIANVYDRPAEIGRGWIGSGYQVWGRDLDLDAVTETYTAVFNDLDRRRAWLSAVRRYGFARVTDAPRADATPARLAELFGFVRETNYGRVFNVRTEARPSNLADTSRALQPHTDNPYRDPPPGLQILACLENSAVGGESLIVDGFSAALRVLKEAPDDFERLARYPARFDYRGAPGVRLAAKRPLIELGPDGELLCVRFNNRSAAPLLDAPFEVVPAYYRAYRRFAAAVGDPSLQVRFRLEPGELFIVDNLRVLHGRTAFSGAGERWLQGCYVDHDGLRSTLAALEEGGQGRQPL